MDTENITRTLAAARQSILQELWSGSRDNSAVVLGWKPEHTPQERAALREAQNKVEQALGAVMTWATVSV